MNKSSDNAIKRALNDNVVYGVYLHMYGDTVSSSPIINNFLTKSVIQEEPQTIKDLVSCIYENSNTDFSIDFISNAITLYATLFVKTSKNILRGFDK